MNSVDKVPTFAKKPGVQSGFFPITHYAMIGELLFAVNKTSDGLSTLVLHAEYCCLPLCGGIRLSEAMSLAVFNGDMRYLQFGYLHLRYSVHVVSRSQIWSQ
jgi:hypothetical protein